MCPNILTRVHRGDEPRHSDSEQNNVRRFKPPTVLCIPRRGQQNIFGSTAAYQNPVAVQGGGLETVCRLCRTCEDFPAKQRPDLSGTGRSRLAGKVALHGGHDKSPKQAKQKSPEKGKHGPADAGRCFSV